MEKKLTQVTKPASLGTREEAQKKIKSGSVEEFLGKLFQSRDAIHLRHLNPTKSGLPSSYAEHMALNTYY